MNVDTQNYFVALAAAFVRGRLCTRRHGGDDTLFERDFSALTNDDLCRLVEIGRKSDLKLHKFKVTKGLPRVKAVLGVLRSLQPESLLDIGSGRGAFLWPLLDTFHALPVMCVDMLEQRIADINCVGSGGFPLVQARLMDAKTMEFPDNSFDICTCLEVLEHMPDPPAVIREIFRVSKRAAVFSVPLHEDDNPEHIHLFEPRDLAALLKKSGAVNVNAQYVLNHMILVATLQ